MAKINHVQNNFLSGQIGRRFFGRTDLKEYFTGAEEIQNLLVAPQGGVIKRPGTEFLGDLGADGAVIPFIFSQDDAYVVYIKPSASSLSDCIKIYPTNGDPFGGVITPVYTTNNQWKDIDGSDMDSIFSKTVPGYAANSQASVNSGVHPSSYLSPNADGFDYVQIGDILIVTHTDRNMHPFYISRQRAVDGTDAWIVAPWGKDVANTMDNTGLGKPLEAEQVYKARQVPYQDVNINPEFLLYPDTNVGVGALTDIYAVDLANAAISVFAESETWAGTLIRIDRTGGAESGVYLVKEWKSSNRLECWVVVPYNAAGTANKTDVWQISSWGANGYPGTVAFYEERTLWGGTTIEGDKIWGSLRGNIFTLMDSVLLQDVSTNTSKIGYFGTIADASKPFAFAIASKQVNPIVWMEANNVVNIGTTGGEYIMHGGDQALSILSAQISKQSSYGGRAIKPLSMEERTIFVGRNGRQLRDFKLHVSNGSFASSDLTTLAHDITEYNWMEDEFSELGFKDLALQPHRNILWAKITNGELVAMTMERDSQVLAWHVHNIGGEVRSLASAPNFQGYSDQVYIIVKRTINSVDKYYLERIGDEYLHDFTQWALVQLPGNADESPRFMDSFKKTDTTSSTITGLSHLEGEEVQALIDGTTVEKHTVSSGQITVSATPLYYVTVGLKFTSRLKLPPVDPGSEFGSSIGVVKDVDKVILELNNSYQGKCGTYSDGEEKLVDIEYESVAPFTGRKEVDVEQTPDKSVNIIVEHDQPFPLEILSLTMRMQTKDN